MAISFRNKGCLLWSRAQRLRKIFMIFTCTHTLPFHPKKYTIIPFLFGRLNNQAAGENFTKCLLGSVIHFLIAQNFNALCDTNAIRKPCKRIVKRSWTHLFQTFFLFCLIISHNFIRKIVIDRHVTVGHN